jgi:hypothetical protein
MKNQKRKNRSLKGDFVPRQLGINEVVESFRPILIETLQNVVLLHRRFAVSHRQL